MCLYLPVVFVEYISGYLDFIASHTIAVVDTREGMWSCSTAVGRIQYHIQRSVRGEANAKEKGDGALVASKRYSPVKVNDRRGVLILWQYFSHQTDKVYMCPLWAPAEYDTIPRATESLLPPD